MERLLSTKEVCHLLGLSPRTVANYVRTGKIKSLKLFSARRFKEEDIRQLIEKAVSTRK